MEARVSRVLLAIQRGEIVPEEAEEELSDLFIDMVRKTIRAERAASGDEPERSLLEELEPLIEEHEGIMVIDEPAHARLAIFQVDDVASMAQRIEKGRDARDAFQTLLKSVVYQDFHIERSRSRDREGAET